MSSKEEWFVVIETGLRFVQIGQYVHESDPALLHGIDAHNAWVHPNTPEEVVQLVSVRLFPRRGKLIFIEAWSSDPGWTSEDSRLDYSTHTYTKQ